MLWLARWGLGPERLFRRRCLQGDLRGSQWVWGCVSLKFVLTLFGRLHDGVLAAMVGCLIFVGQSVPWGVLLEKIEGMETAGIGWRVRGGSGLPAT